LDKDDFIINKDKLTIDYDHIQPCELKRKNDGLQEPFIFFGKKIYGKLVKDSKNEYSNQPIVYYEYVAFNEGRFSKTAKFNRLVIYEEYSQYIRCPERKYLINPESSNKSVHSDPDFTIEKIPKEALEELKEFIERERERLRNSLFCKTIYNAVIEELHFRESNTDAKFFREINRIEDNEKKIRLIQQRKQGEYRQLLVSINGIKQRLLSTNSYKQKSGPNGYPLPAAINNIRNELSELLRQKEEIENKFPASTN
jgi:hypothetical protein